MKSKWLFSRQQSCLQQKFGIKDGRDAWEAQDQQGSRAQNVLAELLKKWVVEIR